MSFEYSRLRDTNGDVLRNISAEMQRDVPWTLKNMLPVKLELWLEKYQSGDPRPFGILDEFETKVFPPSTFSVRDQLFTYIRVHGKLYPLLEPYMFRDIWKTVRLGAVTYDSGAGHSVVQASNWNMRGVWIHNRIRVPLDIYYKGNLVAQVSAYNGIEYMGGGASSIYFDNNREGLNFEDEIEFRSSVPGHNKKLFSVTLDDQQCTQMYVGTVSGGLWGPNPDNAVHRVHKPVFTGVGFYVPAGGYRTRLTDSLQFNWNTNV